MSSFLKFSVVITIILLSFTTITLHAQCVINKKTKNNVLIVETPEKYEYLRTNKQYYGLAIKTAITTTAGKNSYKILVKYTGGALTAQPTGLNFVLKDGYILRGNLKFVNTQKVDNSKIRTRVYEIILTDDDLNRLKQAALQQIDILINKQGAPVTILVDDETFIQSQLSCLQNTPVE